MVQRDWQVPLAVFANIALHVKQELLVAQTKQFYIEQMSAWQVLLISLKPGKHASHCELDAAHREQLRTRH
jgi:hypothetical protein